MSEDKPTAPQLDDAVYDEKLRQAINQNRTARILIARQVNSSTQSVYWNLGMWLRRRPPG
jgi:hypothetical protein